jgi:hypothetical protein
LKQIVLISLFAAVLALEGMPEAQAQRTRSSRLPPDVFDVTPPSDYVEGEPGTMRISRRSCRVLPTGETRRRIVNVAVQEWAYFGFGIVDRTRVQERFLPDGIIADEVNPPLREPRFVDTYPRLGMFEDSGRAAASIGGYWAATPEGEPILNAQNMAWSGPGGDDVTWQEPWSAAFVSWVMCESGLGASSQFQRSVAHRVYIDQAIRARDGNAAQAAFVAYDRGEAEIVPGDLLCTARRPVYRTIADRRRQMGVGARTHCDVVVSVDVENERILAVGGNVNRSVTLKLIPAMKEPGKPFRPVDGSLIDGARTVFAHLKLRAERIEAKALDNSPTITALECMVESQGPVALGGPSVGTRGQLC